MPAKPLTADMDLRKSSGLTAAEIDKTLRGSPLAGLGKAFIQAEKKHKVSALFLLSMAVWESGALDLKWWKKHKADRQQFRIFGWHSSPLLKGFADGVDKTARHYAEEYLDPKGECYGASPTLRGVSVWWISDRVQAEGLPSEEAERERFVQAILETSKQLLARLK